VLFISPRPRFPLLCVAGCLAAGVAVHQAAGPARWPVAIPDRAHSALGRLPLSFAPLASRGYVSQGRGFSLQVDPRGAEFRLATAAGRPARLGLSLIGADPHAVVAPEALLPGRVSYFFGNDPAGWRRDLPTYGQVRCASVYPGVDVVYYGTQQALEYDLVVQPGSDPSAVRWRVSGASRAHLEADGSLLLQTPAGSVRQHRPAVYQERDGRREAVSGRYVLTASAAGLPEVGFAVGEYDRSRPLVIDPVLSYSTYLGGDGTDKVAAVAVDGGGNLYVAGNTTSTDFPTTPGAVQPGPGGTGSRGDLFVAKLDPSGSALLSATYVGGFGEDTARGIALDGDGNAYVTGQTDSGNFPIANALYATGRGDVDAFLLKLSADGGTLVYSTYFGGQGKDFGVGVGVDSFGNACVAGQTASANFPVQNAAQPQLAGTQTRVDAFVTRFTASGGSLIYSTYLGGSQEEVLLDDAGGIAVEPNGAAYVASTTNSTDFPTTAGVLDPALGGTPGSTDGFVTKFSPEGVPAYSTYLGGSANETVYGVAVDGQGEACVVGSTASPDLPVPNAFQEHYGGDKADAFVLKLTSDGTGLVYGSYLGGSGRDDGYGIAVDAAGSVYVTGRTFSPNFPIARPLQPPAGNYDAFLARVSPSGNLAFSTYLGGVSQDSGYGVAVDPNGEMYVAGNTLSTTFPTLFPLQATLRGNGDAFVARISEGSAPPVFPTGLTAVTVCNTSATLSWTDNSDNEDAFEIERRIGAGPWIPVGAVSANVVQFEATDLNPSATYLYRVRATNDDGASSYSNELTVITLLNTVSAPSNLAITVVDHTQLKLTWTDNSGDEAGFRIERSTDGGTTYARVQTVAANSVEYTDTGLTPATAYTYRVRANGAGCDSAPTASVTASTPPEPVTAPSNLTGRALSDTEITLSWKDNSEIETGFKIERAGSGSFEEVGSVDPNVTTFVDSGLGANTAYHYRVRAVNGSVSSPPTDEVRITTLSPATGILKVTKKVNFGKVKIGETKSKKLVIRNGSRVDRMKLTVGTLLPPYTVATAGSYTVLIGGNRTVTLTFTPTTTGKSTTKLVLTSSDPKHSRVEVTLTGTGRTAPVKNRKK
jgi:hypothetical protein